MEGVLTDDIERRAIEAAGKELDKWLRRRRHIAPEDRGMGPVLKGQKSRVLRGSDRVVRKVTA